MPDVFDHLTDESKGDIFDQAAGSGDIFDEVAKPTIAQNATKAGYNLIAGGAEAVAGVGAGLQRLADPGPLPNNFRNFQRQMIRAGADQSTPEAAQTQLLAEREAQRQTLMAPGHAITAAATPYAEGAQAIADETPGNEHLAKAAKLVGGMVPLLGVAAVPGVGPAAASVVGGLQATGDTYAQALQFYQAQGMAPADAQRAADDVAIKTGINSGAVYSLLPGAGQSVAEKLMAERLVKAAPWVQAGVRTLAQGADGSLVMGANSLITSAQAIRSYRPELTWQDAMKEAAKQAAVGFAASAAIHGTIEGVKLLRKPLNAGTEGSARASGAPRPAEDELPLPVQTSVQTSGRSPVPVPEAAETIAAQVAATQDPASSKAVTLITPGEAAPTEHGLTAVETTQGTALVNPAKVNVAEAQAQLNAGAGGELLGFSTATKPDGAAHILQTTDARGHVIQDEVVTPATLEHAIAASQAVAPNGELTLRPAEDVIAERHAANPAQTQLVAAPAGRIAAAQITTRADLMQFKRMDNPASGVNARDKLSGKWDDLKGGNLLLWEPKDPAEYGLKSGQKYIVANGHHRFEFGERQGVTHYNAQVIREADGFSAQDARSLAAEINIADGKGTIYDQVKFLRNEAATHGPDAALARAGRIGVKGGQAAAIAFAAGPDLHAAFVNEQIEPTQAETIARSAPAGTEGSEGLQRLGIRKAIDGAGPTELRNLMQAVRLEARSVPAEQFDLFAADDSAIRTAEQLAKVAGRIQGELTREIRSTEAAAKNATTAKAKGLKFERPPEEILADNMRLKGERDQWDNWALHPELVQQVRDYAAMGRAQELRETPPPYRAKGVDIPAEGATLPLHESQEVNAVQGRQPAGGDGERGYAGPGRRAGQPIDPTSPEHSARLIQSAPTPAAKEAVRRALDEARAAKAAQDTLVSNFPRRADGSLDLPRVATDRLDRMFALDQQRTDAIGRALQVLNYSGIRYPTPAEITAHGIGYTPKADPIESKLSQWIKATDFDPRNLGEGVTGAPVWIVKSAVNGLLRVVRAAYVGGRSLASAIEDGVDWLRSQNLQGFDADQARAWMSGVIKAGSGGARDINVRGFTDKLDAAQDVADGIKGTIGNTLYTQRTNETDAQTAARLIQQTGLDAAVPLFADKNNGIPGSVRGLMGQLIIKQLSAAGRLDDAIAFHDNHFADHITEVAQTLQAQRAWLSLTPEGQVIWAKKQMDGAARDRLAPVRPDLQAAQAELERQNETGVRATTADPQVQAAARQIVDGAVAASPEVHHAIVMELAQDFAQSPYILNAAREQVRAKANDLLSKAPRPPGLTPSQHLRVILDDLAQRSAGIAASYFQGLASHAKGLGGLIAERLGIEPERAGKLATALEKEWARLGEDAKARLPKAIKDVRAAIKAGNNRTPDAAENNIDAAIRRQLRETQQHLGTVIYEHWTKRERVGQDLQQSLVNEAGLTGPDAQRLADVVRQRFEALTSEAKQRALERLLKPVQSQGITRPGLVDRLLKLSHLGAFDDARWWNVVKEKLNLPTWTEDLQRQLKAHADRIAGIPEDRVGEWQKAQTDFMNTLARAKGFDWFDANHAFFITNLLTGLSTHLRVAIHTSANLMGSMASEVARAVAGGRVADIPLIFEAAGRGGAKSLAEQVDIMKSGQVTGSKVNNVFAQRFHELSRYGHRGGVPIDTSRGTLPGRVYAKGLKALLETSPARILNLWKYNDRLVTAQHVLYFKPAEEMKVALLTTRLLREQGLSSTDAVNEARQVLGYGAQAVAEAKAQSAREGLTGFPARKRAGEILENRRPDEVKEDAKQYALRQTFLNEPYGIVGAMAKAVENAKRSDHAGLSRSAKIVAPFVRIAANLFNEGLNYTPVGAARAVVSRRNLMGMDVADLSPAQRGDLRSELMAKASLGTALFGGLAIQAAMDLGNSNPGFTIYGSGPSNPEDKARWRAAGAIPWSVKIGNQYLSYANTPANVAWGALGNYLDRARDAALYKRASAERVADNAVDSASVALTGAGKVMLEQPFLQSLTELADMTSQANPELAARQAQKFAVRTLSSAVVPNALRQVDRIFDPTVFEQRNLTGILTSSVPFVRREGRPVLNVFGQPLQSPLSSMFASQVTDDPVVKTLTKYNVWPSMPGRNSTLVNGVPLTDNEFYQYQQVRGAQLREWLSGPHFERNLAKVQAQSEKLQIQAAGGTVNAEVAQKIQKAAQGLPEKLVSEYDRAASKRAAQAIERARH